MKKRRASPAFAAIGFCLAACSQEAPLPAEPLPQPTALQEDAPTPSPAILPVQIPPSSEVIIERIESVMVSRPSEQPEALVVHASGLVGSRGWSRPRLVPADPEEASDMVSLHFVATSPEQETRVSEPQPLEARLEMPTLPSEVKSIRIVGVTNELSTFVGN